MIGAPAGVPPSALRVSDAERHEVCDLLSRHFADGRLDQAELDERVGRAMAAKTRGELTGLLADLPRLDGATPAAVAAPPRRHGRARQLAAIALSIWLVLAVASFLAHTVLWHLWIWRPHAHGLGLVLVIAAVALLLRRARRRRPLSRRLQAPREGL